MLERSSLGPSDVFDLRVFGEDDMSGAYRVSDDGTIDFPLVGKLVVEGETASSLSTKLSVQLGKYLKQPSVSVFIKEYNSKKVFVPRASEAALAPSRTSAA